MWYWVARYRTILRQWPEVEAEMAKNYGLSLQDLFKMSWRRFRVLFEGIFSWPDDSEEPYEPGQGRIASQVDWGSGEQVPVPDLMSQFSGTKIDVGRNA